MKGKKSNVFIYMILTILAVVFLAPIFIILFNSFKGKLYISDAPFNCLLLRRFQDCRIILMDYQRLDF